MSAYTDIVGKVKSSLVKSHQERKKKREEKALGKGILEKSPLELKTKFLKLTGTVYIEMKII